MNWCVVSILLCFSTNGGLKVPNVTDVASVNALPSKDKVSSAAEVANSGGAVVERARAQRAQDLSTAAQTSKVQGMGDSVDISAAAKAKFDSSNG